MATESSAADDRTLRVNATLSIPRTELEVRATRASGAGGQHVNKTATRIEVIWNIASSPSLHEDQRARLMAKLETKLASGELRVVASDTRSQLQNKMLAYTRLAEIVRRALVVPRKRRATRPTRASKEARLENKKRRSNIKRDRRAGADD